MVAEGTVLKRHSLRAWCYLQTVAVAREEQKREKRCFINYALLEYQINQPKQHTSGQQKQQKQVLFS